MCEGLKSAGNAFYKKGEQASAIEQYSLASRLDPLNPVYHSNKSASFQAQKRWKDAAASARDALAADPTFVKGYVHLTNSLSQLGKQAEARAAVEKGIEKVQSDPEKAKVLNKLLSRDLNVCNLTTDMQANNVQGSAGPATTSSSASAAGTAAALKEKGNACYKSGNYSGAIQHYTHAIKEEPENGLYYGNRAACWMMLKKYERAVKDCSTGLSKERVPGELGKLRLRMANGLMLMQKVDRAADVLQEGVVRGGQHAAAIEAQFKLTQGLLALQNKGNAALESKDWPSAQQHFQQLLKTEGLSEHTGWRMGLVDALYGLEQFGEAARMAQLVIADQPDSAACYLTRAWSLRRMGLIDKAIQTLAALIQRDPDNAEVSIELKKFRHLSSEIKRIDQAMEVALKSRDFELAVALSTEGSALDSSDKRLVARMLVSRGKARHMLAKTTLSANKVCEFV